MGYTFFDPLLDTETPFRYTLSAPAVVQVSVEYWPACIVVGLAVRRALIESSVVLPDTVTVALDVARL
ncbi:MAG: hypothetical protein DMF84_16080 [Acidobacteria bacterium]|nr:MAG: hypothetical protein DMF84_16080 [Acidobacteriota bacterium]